MVKMVLTGTWKKECLHKLQVVTSINKIVSKAKTRKKVREKREQVYVNIKNILEDSEKLKPGPLIPLVQN